MFNPLVKQCYYYIKYVYQIGKLSVYAHIQITSSREADEMAKIIGLEKQKKALKEISTVIKEINSANEFLNTSNPTGEYTISFIPEAGKKVAVDITVSNKETIDQLVHAYKAMVRDHVTNLAAEHYISLDDQEKAILGIE